MSQFIVFICICIYFLWLGSRFIETGKIKPFLLSSILLPFVPAFGILHFRFHINAYAFFTVFPVFIFTLKTFTRTKLRSKFVNGTVAIVAFLSLYLLISKSINENAPSLINILKDIKPFVLIGIGFIFLEIMSGRQIIWSSKLSKKLLKLNFIVSVFYYIILTSTSIIAIVAEDPFYKVTVIRYIALGTFFSLFYLIAKFSENKPISIWEFVYILTPLFLSGNRTLFFIIAILLLVNLVYSISNVKRFIQWSLIIVFGLFVLAAGVMSVNSNLKTRLLSALDLDLVKNQLFEYRFAPFLDAISNFEWYNFAFGKGLGETFYIPWFVWRVDIDNYNIYMDNLYLTLFVKYGFLSFLIYIILVMFLNATITNRKFKVFVIIYFVLIGFTTAYIYQYTFFFIVLMLTIFKNSESSHNSIDEPVEP